MSAKSLTIPEIKSLVSQKLQEIRPYGSKPISQFNIKVFRDYINLCTSISIKLLQFDLIPDTLEVLIKASEADKTLTELGSIAEPQWQGRLLTYHTLAYLYYRTNQLKKSLKVLYDAQQLMEAITSSKHPLCPDFNFTGSLLIFMNLWKARKVKEAKEYLESCKAVLASIGKFGTRSKISNLSRANLSGLLALASAGLWYSEGNHSRAVEICEHSLEYLMGDEVVVRPAIYNFLKKAKAVEGLESDWVTNKEFDSIVLVSCFIPYITAGTPGLRIVEKVEVRNRCTSRNSSQQSSRRNNSLPQSRIKVRNGLTKSWWNNTSVIVNKTKVAGRRTSEGGNSSRGSKLGGVLEGSFNKGKTRIYSPSVGTTISTPRRKLLGGRAATMAELPLELIKGIYQRPFSSK